MSVSDEFVDWLLREMEKRRWSQSEFARTAGVSRGAIGNVLRREREPGKQMLVAIAHAFDLPAESVMRKAGVLPPESDDEDMLEEWHYYLSRLDEKDRAELLAIAKLKIELNQAEKSAPRRQRKKTGERPVELLKL